MLAAVNLGWESVALDIYIYMCMYEYVFILYVCVHSAHSFVVFTLKSFKYAVKLKESDAIFYAFLCFRYLVPE